MNADAVKQIKVDFGMTFRSEQGQRVLYTLANMFNLFKPHVGTDPIELAIQEGRRQVILTIIELSTQFSMEKQGELLIKEVIK